MELVELVKKGLYKREEGDKEITIDGVHFLTPSNCCRWCCCFPFGFLMLGVEKMFG